MSNDDQEKWSRIKDEEDFYEQLRMKIERPTAYILILGVLIALAIFCQIAVTIASLGAA